MHVLLKISYCLFRIAIYSGAFRVSGNQLGFGDHRVWFWVWVINRKGVRGGFEFGFGVRVCGEST
jgi:hypothetical protein